MCVQAWMKTSPDATNGAAIQELMFSICQSVSEPHRSTLIGSFAEPSATDQTNITNIHSLTHTCTTSGNNDVIQMITNSYAEFYSMYNETPCSFKRHGLL